MGRVTMLKGQLLRRWTSEWKPEKIWGGTSLVAQWLRFHASTAGVRSLVRELRFRMLRSAAKKKRKKKDLGN